MAEPSYPFTTYVGVPEVGASGTFDGIHILTPIQLNIDNEGNLYWLDGGPYYSYVLKKPTSGPYSTLIHIDTSPGGSSGSGIPYQRQIRSLAAAPSGNVFMLIREDFNPLSFQSILYEITDGSQRFISGGNPLATDSQSFPFYSYMDATDSQVYMTGTSLLENTQNPGSDYHGELQSVSYSGARKYIVPEDYPLDRPNNAIPPVPFWNFFEDPDLPGEWVYQAEGLTVDPEGNTYLFAGFTPGGGVSFSQALQSSTREYSVYKVSPDGSISVHARIFKAGLGLNQEDVVYPRGISWAIDGNIYVCVAIRQDDPAVATKAYILRVGDSGGQIITQWKEQSDDPDEILGLGGEGLVADLKGNLYFTVQSLGARHGTRAYTIQKIGGVFEAAPMLSSKQDDFASGDVSGWTETGLYSITNEVLNLGDLGTVSTLKTTEPYIYDSVFGQFKPAGAADFTMRVEDTTDPGISSQFWIHGGVLQMQINGGLVGSVSYNKTSHEWLRMVRSGSKVTFSAAGTELVNVGTDDKPEYQPGPKEWSTLGSGTIGSIPLCNFMVLVSGSALAVDNINILPDYPSTEPPEPPPPDPYGDGDPSDPNSKAPPTVKEKTCTTYLDEVRLFSNRSGYAVRITGPRRIEIVNRSGGLPTGWTQAEDEELYYSASREVKLGENELSLREGYMSMNGGASLRTDDVRILGSSWRIPGKLPAYNLEPASVQRCTFSFTKDHFNAEVTFAFIPVPLKVRPT
jgi:hypothetical protein